MQIKITRSYSFTLVTLTTLAKAEAFTSCWWGCRLEEALWKIFCQLGFPDSSVGKESACNAGDPCLIPELGRYAGEGIGYPLLYSWALLVAHLGKNPPAMQEAWVWLLGWEDSLEKGKATHSSILAWRIPWGHKESDETEWVLLSHYQPQHPYHML